MATHALDNVLVVCCRLHQRYLANMLRDSAHEVIEIDLLAETWYSEHWTQDFLNNEDYYDELDRQFRMQQRMTEGRGAT